MSTPGPDRVPSTVKVDKTSGQGKPPAAKSTPKSGGTRPGAKGGGKGRKPVTPVKVAGGRNWGPIMVAGVVILIAVGIIGFGVFSSVKSKKELGTPWEQRAAAISGITNIRASDPELMKGGLHQQGTITYKQSPPVAGPHNNIWQNCNGVVYPEQIANENAVHSLEHGAVWITYRPDLPADQVAELAKKVNGTDKTLMSPFPGLDKPISLQVWGYQLKVDKADDPRIDDFIRALRVNASIEGPTALCDGGTSGTGATPKNTAGGM